MRITKYPLKFVELMSKIIKKGTKVYWNDPAGETSGMYKIAKDVNVNEDNIALINNEYSEAEVFLDELVFEELVVFRKFLGSNEIIALFPEQEWNTSEVVSYMHTGQHSGAHYHHVIKGSTPTTEEEYKSLLDELTNIVGYPNLRIIKKYTPKRK